MMLLGRDAFTYDTPGTPQVLAPPVLTSIQVFDGDGLNDPQVGFTNSRDVRVITTFAGPDPEFLEITDDGFATSVTFPYAQSILFAIARTTDGPFVIQCRGIASTGTSNEGYYEGTFDTVRPGGQMSGGNFQGSATSLSSATIRLSTSEPLNRVPDPADPAQFELLNCVLGPGTAVSPTDYEYPVTHLENGRVQVRLLANQMIDRAGNSTTSTRTINYLFDDEPPTAAMSIPQVATGRDLRGIFTASDVTYFYAPTQNIPPISSRQLYSRRLGGDWNWELFSKTSGDEYIFTPGGGVAGTYFMLFRAVDRAGNESSPIPTGAVGTGMAMIHYNPDPNQTVSNPVFGAGSYYFAMENDVLVRIDLEQVSGTGTLSVSRDEGDLGPFAGTGQMIHERLNIAYSGFTFGSATLTTSYQDENLGGVHESSIVTAARVRGSADTTFFPASVETNRNRVTVSGITNLRDAWYFGRMSSHAANWAMYE